MDYLKTRAPFWKQVEKAGGKILGRRQGRPMTRRPSAGQSRVAGVKRRNERRWRLLEGKMVPIVVAAIALVALGAPARRRPRKSPTLKCRAARIRTTLRRRRTAASGTRRNRQGALGILNPKSGQGDANFARRGRRAAWCHRRARPCRLDHRWRAERDRALRSGDQGGEAFSAAEGISRRQSQHRDLRPQRHSLVHRSERRLWPCRSGERKSRSLESAERRRTLRHHDDAER